MKQFSRFNTIVGAIAFSVTMLVSSVASVHAAPANQQANETRPSVSGPQAKPAIEAGSKDAKTTAPLGATNAVATEANGEPKTLALTGTVAGVDFQPFYNYCSKNLVYTTVKNSTTALKYIQVRVWNQGHYRELSTSVAAGGTYSYPAFYGVDGAYTAYLYVWNGTSYQYDEYQAGTNTCNVSVTRVYNTGGWVQLKIQNLGTAYASQTSSELAPYPASGTYTGTHYDYPVAGGAAIYRWFQVGTQPYGIVSSTSGSSAAPYLFTGDL
jgi:hypothetical protein